MRRTTYLTLTLCSAFVLSTAAVSFGWQIPADRLQKIADAIPAKATAKPQKPRKLLIYTLANGYVHGSIPYGAKAVELMGAKTGAWSSVVSDNPESFAPESLKAFDAVLLCNTTGDWLLPRKSELAKLPKEQQEKAKAREAELKASLLAYVRGGGGLAGFHSASDSQYGWKEFGQMFGGYFAGHPWHEKVGIKLIDPGHPLLRAFGGHDFEITDEIYQFRDPYSRDNLHELLALDTSKTNMKKGGINRKDGDFAVAWCRDEGKGHIFYSSLGHREEIYWNPTIMAFYLDGIQFAMGDLKADATPTSKAKADAGAGASLFTLTSVPAAKLDLNKLLSCSGGPATHLAALGAKGEKGEKGARVLFDGKSLDQWTFKKDGWVVEDGAMALKKGGGYIWTKDNFENFVLTLQFKVSKGCNSGIFFRTNPKNPVNAGFEIQVMDSYGHKPGKHDCGALYDAVPPSTNAMKPAGEWNTFKLVCKGAHVTVVLNDQKVVMADLDHWKEAHKNPDGSQNKFPTALKDLPRTGKIGFQDHGHEVWYKDVKVQVLE